MNRAGWLCCAADLHGLLPQFGQRVDAILLAGDLCPDAHQIGPHCRVMDPCHLEGQRRFMQAKVSSLATAYDVPVFAVPGNHDFGLVGWSQPVPGVTLLVDSLATLPCGATVWGSPWTSSGMAFNSDDDSLAGVWDQCPAGVDVMLTHVPPYGIGDDADRVHIGSRSLLAAVQRIKPRLHLFGHAHERRGCWQVGSTLHVNCTLGSHNGRQSQHGPWLLCDSSWR